MTGTHSSFLDVPGARLYFETSGAGPLVVMVPGAAGSAEPYRGLVLAVGRESRGYPCSEATLALGRAVETQPVEMPGGHVGFVSQAPAFAHALVPYLDLGDNPAGATSGAQRVEQDGRR